MQFLTPILALSAALLPALTSAHGLIQSPPSRRAGNTFKASCGTQIYNVASYDPYGPMELWAGNRNSETQASCQLNLCKGFKQADGPGVQRYTPGQNIPFTIEIRARHPGYANVSIVDTRTNKVIGTPLKTWANYASTENAPPIDETQFTVKMPQSLNNACATAGNCVIQWYWLSPLATQTYTSCVDFTMSG